MVIVLAIISSMIGLSLAKIGQAGMSATASNTIAMQASNIASSDAALLHAVNYEDLTASNRSAVSGTAFQHETLLSNESSYTDTIKQKIATINVYKGDESIPRSTLQVTRYSVEKQESSGVPVGTVIAWAGSKAPTTNGTWLECNGQSCAAYPELVAVLGKNTVPDYRDRFLESSETVGTIKEAGLPNIQGKVATGAPSSYWINGSDSILASWRDYENSATGPFSLLVSARPHILNDGANSGRPPSWQSQHGQNVYFDASRSNSIYGSSTTVQPASVTVKRFIKAA